MTTSLEKAWTAKKITADKTSKITIELLLSTTAVATSIVLAARLRLLEKIYSKNSSVLISPAVLISDIKASRDFIDNTSFVLDRTCLEHGLIIHFNFLTNVKRGFRMELTRGNEEESIAAIGEWEVVARAVRIDPTKLFSFDSLKQRFGTIVGETVEIQLVRYIGLVRDELFASKNLQPTSLSAFCRNPQVLIDMLMKQAESLKKLKALEAENEYLESQQGQFHQPLRDTLRAELKEVHDVLIRLYGPKTTSMSKDPDFTKNLVNKMWEACVRDAHLAPTWFNILFFGTMSDYDLGILKTKGTPNLVTVFCSSF